MRRLLSQQSATPEYWDGLSDPATHDSSKFRLHTHSFIDVNPSPSDVQHYVEEAAKLGIVNIPEGQKTNLCKHPERLSDRGTMSTSLIDQDHPRPYAAAGLLIGVPPGDILATRAHDMGTVHGDVEIVRRIWGDKYPPLEPDELLLRTNPRWYNEIAIAAGDAALLGFFYTSYDSESLSPKSPVNQELAELVTKHATHLDLPLVEVPLYRS